MEMRFIVAFMRRESGRYFWQLLRKSWKIPYDFAFPDYATIEGLKYMCSPIKNCCYLSTAGYTSTERLFEKATR